MHGLRSASPTCAVVDMGSNSLHLQVGRRGPAGLETLATERASIRLGELVDGGLDPAKMDAVEHTLAEWLAEARALGAVAFEVSATAAVRDANNTAELHDRLARLGLRLVLLSGREEGLRTWQGAKGALGWREGLLLDMGGRSLELVREDRQGIRLAVSVGMGHLVATSIASIPEIEARVRALLAPIERVVPPQVALTAGTALTLTRMAAFARGEAPEGRHGLQASLPELVELEARLHREDPASMAGVDLRRADTLPWGATALRAALQELGIQRWTSSQAALRSGLLQDLLSDPRRAPCP